MGLRYIEDLQAAAVGVVHGVGRAAGGLRQIANANAAVIHKMPVPFLHTAPKVVLRRVGYLVRTALDLLVDVTSPLSGCGTAAPGSAGSAGSVPVTGGRSAPPVCQTPAPRLRQNSNC